MTKELGELKLEVADKLEDLKMQRERIEFQEALVIDELERLENMGTLQIFEDGEDRSVDYMLAAHPEDWRLTSKLVHYHPVGTKEYEQEYMLEHNKQKLKLVRKLSLKEANEMTRKLSLRRKHALDCDCEICLPNGATNHILSFALKPSKSVKF